MSESGALPEWVTLPSGVDPADVTVESDAEAVAEGFTDEWGEEYSRPFNPQNGRWYSYDCHPDYHSAESIRGGITVDCAYKDCSGTGTVEVEGSLSRAGACPVCGEPRMGREQFTKDSKRKRSDRRHISGRMGELSDEFAREMERLRNAGVGSTAAVDYLMCSVGDSPFEEWAEARGVKPRSVKRNMKRVANALGETVSYTSDGRGR